MKSQQMSTGGVLLLSHCGFSFLEDLIAALEERGFRSFVLSSLPLFEHRPQRLANLQQQVTCLYSTDAHELKLDDVDSALEKLRMAGERVLACISVWEGYRGLMAYANAKLGVPDLSCESVAALRDKLALRNRLHGAGLTQLHAQILTPEVLARLQLSDERYFIKPVSGIASYGAFPLRKDTTWREIQSVRDEAKEDVVYRSALSAEQDFLIEDYLAGREFSFELIVVEAQVFVVGIHEKCGVTESLNTVLEDSCTSPPYSINQPAVAAGVQWVRAMFAYLQLDWGCFHVEARYDGCRWDLIEINPRVGGSLISHSVKALNGGFGVLELWLDLLTSHGGSGAGNDQLAIIGNERYLEQLRVLSYTDDGAPPTSNATFFRVYFAGPGIIEQVAVRTINPAPVISQVLLKEGDKIANSAREVFLGQLLWTLTREQRDTGLSALLRSSDGAIEIRYLKVMNSAEESIAS